MVLLVALRLVTGWHFYSEGVSHLVDRTWSSEGFLKQAKGPFAGYFQSKLPDFHGFSQDVSARDLPKLPVTEPKKLLKPFQERVAKDWEATRQKYAKHYKFDDAQQKQSEVLHNDYVRRLDELLDDDTARDIVVYRYELARRDALENDPATGAIPFERERLGKRRTEVAAKPNPWLGQMRALESSYELELANLAASEAQKKLPPVPVEPTELQTVDKTVTYLLIGVGASLILGLFARIGAIFGAGFLLSVMATQPPWVTGTIPIYLYAVEMVALLALASMPIGRWGGLDFFLHRMFCSSRPQAQGEKV